MMNDDTVRFWRPSAEPPNRFLGAYLDTRFGTPHVHEEWQFAVAEHPASVLVGAFRHHAVRPGDVIAIPPYVVHAELGWAGLQERWHLLHVDASVVTRIADRVARGPSRTGPASRGPVLTDPAAATELSTLLEKSALGADCTPRTIEWVRRLLESHALTWPVPSSSAAVERARMFIRDHPTQSITLGDVVAFAGVSASHLVRTFSRLVGLPPMSYHVQIRLARARRLLSDGKSVTWVAYECGFADQSHLSRRFKQCYGVTPSAFQMQATSDATPAAGVAAGGCVEIGSNAA